MKILMLADTMDIGGAETHIYELSHSLFSMGHQIKIFSRGGRIARRLGECAELIDSSACGSFLGELRALAKLLRSFKPDVVHAHTRRGLFMAETVLKLMPFPLVFTAHAKFSTSPIKRFLTNPPLYTIAVSEDIKEHFISRFSAKCVEVIENGINTELFSPFRTRKSRFNILNVSRLDDDCSLTAELLCRIAPKLSEIFPNCVITVVGGGNHLKKIKALTKRANAAAGREIIRCVGAQAEVLPFIRESDIFIGVSRAALEAMSCGIPTVICGNEGFFGVCHRGDFKLCAKENFCARGYEKATEQQLLEQILLVKKDISDKRLFVRDLVCKGFSSKAMAEKTLSVYRKAVLDASRHRKHDAVICGYYGFGNLGDEIVLKKLLESLGDRSAVIIGAMGEGRIWRFNLLKIAFSLRSSGVLILGGGSLLQNATSDRSLKYYLTLLKIAYFFGRRIMLYANGLGPINSQKALSQCAGALKAVDIASFRDRESMSASKNLLTTSALTDLSHDPALTPLKPQKTVRRIAIFIRGRDFSKELASALAKALAPFSRKGYRIVFASMNSKEDEKTAAKLAELMPFVSGFRWFKNPDKLVDFISSSKIVVSSRLHALILAASSSRPFVALCHDPKLKAFASECDIPPLLAPELSNRIGNLQGALKYAIDNERELSQKISYSVKRICRRFPKDSETLLELF